MSQTLLTSFFPVRKKEFVDQTKAKKRKREEDEVEDVTEKDVTSLALVKPCDEVMVKEKVDNISVPGIPATTTHRKVEEKVETMTVSGIPATTTHRKVEEKVETMTVPENPSTAVRKAVEEEATVTVSETPATTTLRKVGEEKVETMIVPGTISTTTLRNVEKVETMTVPGTISTTTIRKVEEKEATMTVPGTPSTALRKEPTEENRQTSKQETRESSWTPASELREKSRIVSFHKLSSLSPKKNASSPRNVGSPRNVDYVKLGAHLTPSKGDEDQPAPKRPAFSRNLFTSESELAAKKATIAMAVTEAKAVKARLSPAEVKARLGNVKLKDLKARLASLGRSGKEAAAASAGPSRSTVRPQDPPSAFLMKLNPPRTPRKSQTAPSPLRLPGVRASPRKVPAYQRFHSLTRPLDKTLPLPYTYRLLCDVFRSVDSVVSMFHNRRELITVAKLETAVKDMTRRPCLPSYLPQIRCVFPEAFTFSWVKVERGSRVTYSLQVFPNLCYKRSLLGGLGETPILQPTCDRLTTEHLVERRQIFNNALLQLVRDQHATFLSGLEPPIVVDDTLLTAWHRDFNVDSCPDVEEISLPCHPEEEKVVSLKEPKVEDEEGGLSEKENSSETVAATPTTASGLPSSLLAKIRAKEAAKAIREMTRSQEEKRRIAQLRKLPGHARFMRTLLISERRASVTVEFAVTKLLVLSPVGTERKALEEELRALSVESSGWLSLHRVAMEDIFKIAKPHRINDIVSKLEEKLAEALK